MSEHDERARAWISDYTGDPSPGDDATYALSALLADVAREAVRDERQRRARGFVMDAGVALNGEQVEKLLALLPDATAKDLREAVAFMGDGTEDGDENIAVVQWSETGHGGPGLYVHCGEYPDEGTCYVGAKRDDVKAAIACDVDVAGRDA
jgi:hypothetical protein